MRKNMVKNMNSIFIVTEGCIIDATNNSSYVLKAFKTKNQAFDFIEQLYYNNINLFNEFNGFNISNVYIGNNVVRIRGFKKLYNGSTNQFLYKYKIEEIPFE